MDTTVNGLGRKLRTALERGLADVGIRAEVDTENVRTIHLVRAMVTSGQFDEMPHSERQEVVWQIIRRSLSPEEQIRVSIVMTLTPDEVGVG